MNYKNLTSNSIAFIVACSVLALSVCGIVLTNKYIEHRLNSIRYKETLCKERGADYSSSFYQKLSLYGKSSKAKSGKFTIVIICEEE